MLCKFSGICVNLFYDNYLAYSFRHYVLHQCINVKVKVKVKVKFDVRPTHQNAGHHNPVAGLDGLARFLKLSKSSMFRQISVSAGRCDACNVYSVNLQR